ncbi:MAG: type II toxin-antitoxin system VapC family toxin [Candidatus Bathyarchaeia archaeon]
MKLIDSYGWIEYFGDGPLADKYAPHIEGANTNNTVTPTIVVYEVYKRLKKERGQQVALEVYAQMTRTRILPLDEAGALCAADIGLKKDLGMADAIIYSGARIHKAELVTSDQHLKGLEGVTFIE